MKRTFWLLMVILSSSTCFGVRYNADRYAAATNNDRGNVYSEKGQYDQAISAYTKALEIIPSYSAAYYNRGNAYSEKGQYDQAIADYTKALAVDPRFAAAYYDRGFSYFENANMTKPGRMYIRHKV